MEKVSVLLAHNSPLSLQGIKNEISLIQCDIQKEITSGIKALRYILREQPKLAILDSKFNDICVFEIIKEIKCRGIKTKCVVLFKEENYNNLLIANSLQVDGCVSIKDSFQDISPAILTVLRGKMFISSKLKDLEVVDDSLGKLDDLTQTEITILALIGIYKTSTKISEKLITSVRTVEKHRSNIIKKLQLQHKPYTLNCWAIKHQDVIQSFALQRIS
ncbi:MAG: two-component system nitrate/nitrite response regulator NarL [Patiriisocius sp.]|jgi:DNA-binding NarL/FixJ family response regulator